MQFQNSSQTNSKSDLQTNHLKIWKAHTDLTFGWSVQAKNEVSLFPIQVGYPIG